LRARINYAWQPPTLLKVKPLKRPNPDRVQALIREVIGAHPDDYVRGDGWQEQSVNMLTEMIENPTYKSYLSVLFHGEKSNSQPMEGQGSAKPQKARVKKPKVRLKTIGILDFNRRDKRQSYELIAGGCG